MKLLYFEPFAEGHSALWANIVLPEAIDDGQFSEVRLVATRKLISRLDSYAQDSRLVVTELEEQQIAPLARGRLVSKGWNQWNMAGRLLRDFDADTCFLPFFDHALLGACLDRRPVKGKISGVIFRPPNYYGYPFRIKDRISAVRRWAMYLGTLRPAVPILFTFDETIPESWLGRVSGRFQFLPDPAPDMSLLDGRTPRPRTDGRDGMVLFGALAERKGVLTLLDALRRVPPERQKAIAVRLVGRVAGKDRDRIEAALEATRRDAPDVVIELEDRFVTDEELAQEVIDSKIVLAPYQNHVGSSGVLFWAAGVGRPVISQNTGLMGLQASRYQLGCSIDATDPDALAKALSTDPVWSPESAAQFAAHHTPKAFARTILDGLLGSTASP